MSSNTPGADINEIHLAFLLNGNKYPDATTQAKYTERLNSLVSRGMTSEISDQQGRAVAQYNRFVQFLSNKNMGTPEESWWTARAGFSFNSVLGFSVDQTRNPTDVLVKTSKGIFYGISAKSTKAGKTGFKNPGMGTIEKALMVGGRKPFTEIVTRYLNLVKNGPLNNITPSIADTDTARDTYFKNNKSWYESTIIPAYAYPCYEELRDYLYNHLVNNMDPWEHQVFLGYDFLSEDEETMKLPYVKITGSGKNGNYTTKFFDPIAESKMQKIIAYGATFEKKNTTAQNSIQVKANNEDLFQIRWKFGGRAFASSMKLEGA